MIRINLLPVRKKKQRNTAILQLGLMAGFLVLADRPEQAIELLSERLEEVEDAFLLGEASEVQQALLGRGGPPTLEEPGLYAVGHDTDSPRSRPEDPPERGCGVSAGGAGTIGALERNPERAVLRVLEQVTEPVHRLSP